MKQDNRRRGKADRKLIRFYADSSLSAAVEALHPQLSTKQFPGNTVERLVKAAVAMLEGESVEIPPDILEMRRQLGKSSKPAELEVKLTTGGLGALAKSMAKLTDQVGEMLGQMQLQAENQADLIKLVEKRKP